MKLFEDDLAYSVTIPFWIDDVKPSSAFKLSNIDLCQGLSRDLVSEKLIELQ